MLLRNKPGLRANQRGFLLNPYRFGSGGGGPTDPYFNNVKLLLHLDGANGSSTITDSSPDARVCTIVGSDRISTAQSKFGGSSYFCSYVAANRIDVGNPSTIVLGTADYTVEGWFYCSDVVSDGWPWIIGAYGTSLGIGAALQKQGSTIYIGYGKFNPYVGYICSYSVASSGFVNTWHHIAFVRSSGVATIYVDGIAVASGAHADNITAAVRCRIGLINSYQNPDNFSRNYSFAGYIDEFRITQGVARYTSNFTPPIAAFPNS